MGAMTLSTKIIKNSAKDHKCVFCERIMPKGSMYVSAPHKSDEDGSFQDLKFCAECAYILRNADRQNFKPGNFTEQNIPNCLRKIRNEYRKDPMKAWDEQMQKENESK
jgi:hypothetical protein